MDFCLEQDMNCFKMVGLLAVLVFLLIQCCGTCEGCNGIPRAYTCWRTLWRLTRRHPWYLALLFL